ncbi:hypothetical protein [uncultured Finegoldia sp.]|jgi:hypothetical protein|nr:hypothetical protein [uncultured Finegoldia sp.]MDU1832324.1 hypothetical protein [Finegoldia magna]DAM88884.1 MAG TPA: hypothetical protein [Caudoviricetes sp.]
MQYSEKNHKEAMDMLDTIVKKLDIKEEDIEEKKKKQKRKNKRK